ncbi:endonuclease/exonuclease/phosphatase family protein [Brevibacillus ruminantium]|uniref:Endonuclease/exonuclease/phosphatase family protein n=1 Tax=Brevibacillus ruminantium TaxID=2950604 RepID=A0ABY4WJ94_9BACL|nr:endonuclease/exonuclease/phosphatase family protein [Brevibacillus ruminantium]USG67205.1 endonuclease/exonuclease/phosphatase family protein [Brevibacillus ruminantium]
MKRAWICLTILIVLFSLSPSGIEVSNRYGNAGSLFHRNNDQLLRIVTYNIRGCRNDAGFADPAAVASELASLQADVITLQEVDNGLPRSRFQNQVERIAQILGMNYAYGPSLHLLVGTYGNAVLSVFPIQSADLLPLPSGLESRSVLKVTLNINGSPFDVYTTHLGLGAAERGRQSLFLSAYLRKNSGNPAVLAGDFNASSHDKIFKDIRTLFHDPLYEQKLELITLPGKTGKGRGIDHILLSPRLLFQTAEAPRIGHSDHYPVLFTTLLAPADAKQNEEKTALPNTVPGFIQEKTFTHTLHESER